MVHYVGKLAGDHGIYPPCTILTDVLVPCKLMIQFPLREVMDPAYRACVVGVAVCVYHVDSLRQSIYVKPMGLSRGNLNLFWYPAKTILSASRAGVGVGVVGVLVQ